MNASTASSFMSKIFTELLQPTNITLIVTVVVLFRFQRKMDNHFKELKDENLNFQRKMVILSAVNENKQIF